MSLLLLFSGAIASTPPPPPPPPFTGGGNAGLIDYIPNATLFKDAERRRKKRWDDLRRERDELATELRHALDGTRAELPQVSEAEAVHLDIDPRIAGMLAEAEDAPMAQYRALVSQVLAEVEKVIAEENDIEDLMILM